MAQSFFLREQAERCRRLARSASDSVTQERLQKLARNTKLKPMLKMMRTREHQRCATAGAMTKTRTDSTYLSQLMAAPAIRQNKVFRLLARLS